MINLIKTEPVLSAGVIHAGLGVIAIVAQPDAATIGAIEIFLVAVLSLLVRSKVTPSGQ